MHHGSLGLEGAGIPARELDQPILAKFLLPAIFSFDRTAGQWPAFFVGEREFLCIENGTKEGDELAGSDVGT